MAEIYLVQWERFTDLVPNRSHSRIGLKHDEI